MMWRVAMACWLVVCCMIAGCGDGDEESGEVCFASCTGRECGDDGCGNQCGYCAAGLVCIAGTCSESGVPQGDVTEDDVGPPVAKPYELPPIDDPMADSDGDGILDGQDNCPYTANANQLNADEDAGGDACDPDDDNDADLDESDCEPYNPQVNAYMDEICDGIDNDCDGIPDGEGIEGCVPHYVDQDGDGFGTGDALKCLCPDSEPGWGPNTGDCNDGNPNEYPGALEVCDGLDDNCDQVPDDDCDKDQDGYCDFTHAVVGLPAICPLGGGDCDDYKPMVSPGEEEIPGDGLDNNCDGLVDAGFDCPGPCTGHTVDAYLCALEMCLGPALISAEMTSPTGDNISSAWQAVNRFGSASNGLTPMAGESYGLLASGPATGTNHSEDLSGDWGSDSVADPFSKDGFETYDNVEFKVVITAPPNVTGFAVDYVFFSEEYHDWVCSDFNDKFYIFLTAPQTTAGQKMVINYTACSDPNSYHDFIDDSGEKQCYIAINTAYSEPCPNAPTNIAGTGFECSYETCAVGQCTCGMKDDAHGSSTGWLYTAWEIQPNETFELVFHIHDTSDGIYDSEVILDNFQWMTTPFASGTLEKK